MGRIFLSHGSKDKEFVRELYRRLKRDGVDCFFDEESIEWGDNWVRVLEDALDHSSDVVIILSPNFLSSEWGRNEWTSRIADDPEGLKSKLRPLLYRECEIPRFLKPLNRLDISTDELFERHYPNICKMLGGTIAEATARDRSQLPPLQKLPARHRMPYRSLGDKFVGRSDALWEIYDALHKDNTAIVQGVSVVAGTGGLGKTQAAIEYVWRFGAGYPGGVYWVDADQGLNALITQVTKAAEVEVDGRAAEEDQVEELWRKLDTRATSLLVLDNFPEEIALRPYLPTGTIQTLVTTRRQDVHEFPNVRLDVLGGEAGTALLNSGTRRLKSEEAAELVDRLGGLPLALELTKSFLNYRQDLSGQQVLAEMRKSGDVAVLQGFAKRYRDELPSGHERDIALTFQMSWDLADARAQDVLRVMADMAPVGVPRAVIGEVLDLGKPSAFEDSLGESLSELRRLSLVGMDENENPLMHRLVHGFVRYRNQEHRKSFFEKTAAVVGVRMEATVENPSGAEMRELELLLPHAEVMVEDERLGARSAVHLLNRVSSHQDQMGRFVSSLRFAEAALEKAEKKLEPGNIWIAVSQSTLGLVLQDLGRLQEARALLENALASDEKQLAPGHPKIAGTQSNLAQVLQDLGRLEEARALLENALASDEKNLVPGHPSIAIRQSNLAAVLKDLGRRQEASALLEKALAATEKIFTAGHPSIATMQSNLAMVLRDLGRLEEARALLEKALAATEKSFRAGHPSIAIRQYNLGTVLRDLRQREEARELLVAALASFEEKFGPEHRRAVDTRWNLERVLRELGQVAEADELAEKARAAKGGE